MKATWSRELPQIGLIALMTMLAAVTWPWAPDRIAVRWDLQGEVTRYGGKAEGLLLLPALALLVYLFLLVLPRIDPGRANYQRFAGPYNMIRFSLLSLIAIAYGVVHVWIRGYPIDVAAAGLLLVGVMLVIFGVVMDKIRPNWSVGIRTPWTLTSQESWARTHRVGGWLFIVMGLWTLLLAVERTAWALAVWVIMFGATVVVLFAYSYLVWRADPRKMPPTGALLTEDS